ncbi:MAG: methionyl-tRNA formyltransferase, partial [Acidimicrobiales bacterium]
MAQGPEGEPPPAAALAGLSRLAFLGTPAVAAHVLEALVGAGHDVAIVITQPQKGRGPVPAARKAAEARGLAASEQADDAVEVGAELGVVVAYGRIIRPHVLARLPMVNLHFSLLPRWRGAAPVERAILAGDAATGACLMALEEGLDTGPVFACERLAIGEDETAAELSRRLVEAGTALLLDRLRNGLGTPRPQEGEATYAAKVEPHEMRLDWHRPAVEVLRKVRVGRGSWTTFRGRRLVVLDAAVAPGHHALAPGELEGVMVGCGGGPAVELRRVLPEGRSRLAAADWA